MGKRFKKKFRGLCCCNEPSSDSEIKDESHTTIEVVPEQFKKMSKKEILIPEFEQVKENISSIMKSVDVLRIKFEMSQRLHFEMIRKYLVEDVVDVGNIDPLLQGEEQSYVPKSVLLTETGEDTLTSHSVPSLSVFCRRMFYDTAVDTTAQGVYGNGTQLAAYYTSLARHNTNRGLHEEGLADVTGPYQLKKLCLELFALHTDAEARKCLPNNQHPETPGEVALVVDEKDDNISLRGGFGEVNVTQHELMHAGIKEWGMKTIDVNEVPKVIQPFQDIRCLLHKEILTVLNFPLRISLRNLMLRFKFNESHAHFLCINLLKSLKYLHTLNVIHGHMSPNHVIFTQHGYPSVTGFERFKNRPKSRPMRTKAPPRVEFCSPEEITRQPITAATDVFQTGLLVYYLLCAKSPFKADSYQQIKENLLDKNFTPEFESGTLSKDGRYFIRKLLKVDPERRFKLDKCRKPLEKAVQWFKLYDGEELSDQIYPSPFKEFLSAERLEE